MLGFLLLQLGMPVMGAMHVAPITGMPNCNVLSALSIAVSD